MASEETLDPSPTTREIRIANRQRHDCVEVIGKDDDRVDGEGTFFAGSAEGTSKNVDMIDKNPRLSILQRNGEEKGPAGNAISTIENHSLILPGLRFAPSGLRFWRFVVARMERSVIRGYVFIGVPCAMARRWLS